MSSSIIFFEIKILDICLLGLLSTCLNQDSHGFNKGCHFSKVDNPAIKAVAGSGHEKQETSQVLKSVRSVSDEVVCINTALESNDPQYFFVCCMFESVAEQEGRLSLYPSACIAFH